MSVLELLAISIGISGILYIVFYLWYERFPRRPLTSDEVESYLQKIAAMREGKGTGSDEIITRLRKLCANDDGQEFYMVNMIRKRKELPEAAKGKFENVTQAQRAYLKAWARASVQHGSHPIYRGQPYVQLFGTPKEELWDNVSLMRYRSRRDFLNILTDRTFARESALKGLMVEYTDVFPASVDFVAGSPRLMIFLVLLVISLMAAIFFMPELAARPSEIFTSGVTRPFDWR